MPRHLVYFLLGLEADPAETEWMDFPGGETRDKQEGTGGVVMDGLLYRMVGVFSAEQR